jgi:acyl carrier protein
MTKDEIKKEIITVITNTFTEVSKDSLMDDDFLSSSGILDSINILNFICSIEEHFNITIADEDLNLECFMNIDSLSELIQKLLNNKKV